MRRDAFTVTFHATCVPNRDARSFALLILRWWKPDVDAIQRGILEQRWTENLRQMFTQCWKDGTNMQVRVSMKGADPALSIQRLYRPESPVIGKPT